MKRVFILLLGLLVAVGFGYFAGKKLVEGDKRAPAMELQSDDQALEAWEAPADTVLADSLGGE